MTRVHVIISGRVQGVSFRYYTTRAAEQLGVVGWVRNLPDGRVEAVVEGDKEILKQFVAWCGQGPSFGRVDHVDAQWMDGTGAFNDFSIHY